MRPRSCDGIGLARCSLATSAVNAIRSLHHWRWHLDEVYVKINGDMHYLWRAVDHEGEILESYITKTRDKAAALVFMKKALKRHGSPEAITTDSLGSYRAAMKVLDNADKQEVGRWANNRAAAIRSALAFRVARLHRLFCFDGLHRFCLRFECVDLGIHFDMHRIPSADAH